MNLPSRVSRDITISWDTTGAPPGNYTLSARAWPVAGETNVANNIYVDGRVTVTDILRDVAVLSVQPSAQWAYCGRSVMINVTVANNGEVPEVFNVTLHHNFTTVALIGSALNVRLDSLQTTTLAFKWNTTGVPCGREYTITAVASVVPTEANVSNNVMSCPLKFRIRLVGDTNGDDKVDVKDLAAVTRAFGTFPGQPRWNPDADMNGDGKITVLDVAVVSKNFGKTVT